MLNDGFGGPTLEECIEKESPEVQKAINDVIDEAGTSDADWAILRAAGILLAKVRQNLHSIYCNGIPR
jgi:hypothetical protein